MIQLNLVSERTLPAESHRHPSTSQTSKYHTDPDPHQRKSNPDELCPQKMLHIGIFTILERPSTRQGGGDQVHPHRAAGGRNIPMTVFEQEVQSDSMQCKNQCFHSKTENRKKGE